MATAGLIALAVAMGIGRFAFTPLLPMMLADQVVDLHGASWLASANYLGYLVGALLCTLQPWVWARMGRTSPLRATVWLRGGLLATCVLTTCMALPLPTLWPLLRFAAGVASAVVFVYTSSWCLAQLAQMQMPAMGALIFTGPGAGIVLSGLAGSAMVAMGWRAAAGWLLFGLLACGLTAAVWQVFRRSPGGGPPLASAAPSVPASPSAHGRSEVTLLAVAYGLAGFGYIITATFLPVIARQVLANSAWLDLFWPIFGGGVIVGALLASRVPMAPDRRWLLAGCFAVQGLGVVASLISPSLAGFALGSLLLGLPFTAITFFAMQEVRRIRPTQVSSTTGLLTALYGAGQIVGPPLATALLSHSPRQSFDVSLEIAAGALVLGAGLFGAMTRLYPRGPTSTS